MKNNNKPNKPLIGRSAEKWSDLLWDKFLDKLSKAKSKKELRLMLEKLLAEGEKKMVARRLAVIALLRSGKSYQEIGEILWISPNTVSTIKKNILGNIENYKSYRKFYKGPTQWSSGVRVQKSFWENLFGDIDLWDLLTHPPRPHGLGILDAWDVPKRK